MLFDSASPTGGDVDLGTPNTAYSGPGIGAGGGPGVGSNALPLELVLIISEDGDTSDPDDNAGGGKIYIDFDSPVTFHDAGFLDMEETNQMKITQQGGTKTTFGILDLGDNSFQNVTVELDDVIRVEITFHESGALTHVRYTTQCEVGACCLNSTYCLECDSALCKLTDGAQFGGFGTACADINCDGLFDSEEVEEEQEEAEELAALTPDGTYTRLPAIIAGSVMGGLLLFTVVGCFIYFGIAAAPPRRRNRHNRAPQYYY